MRKLLEFANMKEINYSALEAYHRRYNIFFTVDGQNAGGERAVFTKQSRYFFSFDETELDLFLSPSPENEKTLSDLLKVSQKEYCDFLDSCIAGEPDIVLVNERIAQFSAHDLKASRTDEPFKFSFEINFSPRNLENYLDVFSIIYPFWREEGESFFRIKKCKHCENYFHAGSLKAEFCGKKCRNAFNYIKNR